MSRVMQIRVRIEAYYNKDLDRDYPRLAALVRTVDPDLDGRKTALIDLAPMLVNLSQRSNLEPGVSEAINHHGQTIMDLTGQIRDAVGGWKLGEAEKLLGDLEDTYGLMEKELPGGG